MTFTEFALLFAVCVAQALADGSVFKCNKNDDVDKNVRVICKKPYETANCASALHLKYIFR